MVTVTTCKRHPGEETRLHCSNCGDPICPRCAVSGHVGQKCPDCARQRRSARARGKPRQYVKAVIFGLLAAAASGAALMLLFEATGFLRIIASGFAGYGVGLAVNHGAEGNGARAFSLLSVAFGVLAVAVAWGTLGLRFDVGLLDALVPRGLSVLTYAGAAYGAYLPYR